jgi:hypothetical protein
LSDQEHEQSEPETPPTGDEAPPQVEPLSPPDPGEETFEPVGQTEQASSGEPLTDQEQGVGVAPTQPGDAGEGNPGTHFQTTEEIEGKQGEGDDVAGAV